MPPARALGVDRLVVARVESDAATSESSAWILWSAAGRKPGTDAARAKMLAKLKWGSDQKNLGPALAGRIGALVSKKKYG